MILRGVGFSDVGKLRKNNEDSFFVGENFALVADGMGGHNKGEVASKITVDIIKDTLLGYNGDDVKFLFEEAIKNANDKVLEMADRYTSMKGMGTTLVGCVWKDNNVIISNVGDSRCYLFTQNELKQISKDHSFVQQLIDEGEISSDEAKLRVDKNLILRAVGCERDLLIDTFEISVKPNDIILLCSDGLTNMVSDEEIKKIFLENKDYKRTAEKLLRTANKNGGKDNITVVLIKCFGEEEI